MSVTTRYGLAAKVSVKQAKKVDGRVVRISIGECGIEYDVRYFDGVEMKNAWFYEDELELHQ